MKTKAARKEFQAKLNEFLIGFVKPVTNTDSKKIRKSIKKASKLIGKAIFKNTDESEIALSLREKPKPQAKKQAPAKRKPIAKKLSKPVKAAPVRKVSPKSTQRTKKPVRQVKKVFTAQEVRKTDGVPAAPPVI